MFIIKNKRQDVSRRLHLTEPKPNHAQVILADYLLSKGMPKCALKGVFIANRG